MLLPVHPSVCISVTRVDQSKTVELMILQFSLYSPIPLFFVGENISETMSNMARVTVNHR